MAIYRPIHITFWQDKFTLKLTPEQKYFYLYLMTNSKTKQCGVYELPMSVIILETGYNLDTITKLLNSFIEYKKIEYNFDTEEIFIKNWIKYNSVNNINIMKCVIGELLTIKTEKFLKSWIETFKKTNQGIVHKKDKSNNTTQTIDYTILTLKEYESKINPLQAPYKKPTESPTESESETETESETKDIAVSKTETASPKTVVSESHTKAIEMFCDYYQNKTGIKYSFTGKDAKQMQSLLTRISKLITKELTKENLLSSLDYFLKNLNDKWVIENLSIPVINSKFNEILNKIKNHDKFRENSNKRGFVNDTDKWESILEYARTGAGSESAGAVFSSQERENPEGNILALDRQVF